MGLLLVKTGGQEAALLRCQPPQREQELLKGLLSTISHTHVHSPASARLAVNSQRALLPTHRTCGSDCFCLTACPANPVLEFSPWQLANHSQHACRGEAACWEATAGSLPTAAASCRCQYQDEQRE